ncbi:MAG: hemagglutinin, partial [Pseudomonas sp.]
MESNSIKVNIQGNEQRDASGNRDEGKLNNNDVWVDVRELVFVPAGTNGYATDRWYTAGGLLEVSGYLGTQGHSAAEWMAQGGTVNFTGQDLVTQAGSQINLSGGTLDVQSGTVQQTWLRGADGRLYELNSAPGDMLYTGIYKGYEDHSERWGQTKYFYNPLIAPRSRQEAGYTVGRDAGTLVIGTRNAVLEGSVVSDTFQGDRQTQAAQAGLDGYNQSQKAVARGGQLVVGSYVPYYIKESGTLEYALGATANTLKNVVIGEGAASIANGLDLTNVLPADRQGTLYLDSTQLSGFKLGAVKVAASEGIEVNGALQVSPAGNITLFGPQVAVNADITAHGGSIHIGNELNQIGANGRVDSSINPASGAASVQVADGVRLDASGLWGNLQLDPTHIGALPYQNGGSVTLRSSGSVVLGEGSVVDVTSGTALLSSGKLQGGKGGDVTLTARAGELSLGGELRGQGLNGGGTLTLQAGKVLISDTATSAAAGTLLLRGDFFDKGFSAYNLIGNGGLEVADDTQVDVSMPVYRQGLLANGLSTGSKPADALESWTPPLYLENAGKGVLTQRQGASLSLQAGDTAASGSVQPASLLVGKGALINVDHGQAINLSSTGQLTVEGTLNAWGGRISLNGASAPGSSIWVGEQAVLDVAARAVTAIDARGNRYGLVRNGGSIVIGGEIDHSDGSVAQSSGFVVIREGALLDASGTQTTLDIAGRNATTVASNGGSISLASNAGLYLDGQMRANSGGGSSAGGSLSVALKTPAFPGQTSGSQTTVHELMVGQEIGDSKLSLGVDANQAAQTLVHGYARIGVDQVEVGGFDTLSLLSQGMIAFDGDVNLAMGRSLNLYAGSLGLTDASAADTKVQLSAPYVRLFGSAVAAIPDNATGWIQTGMHHGASGFALSQQPAAGSFSLTAGKLLEVTAGKGLGSGGRLVLPGAGGISEQIDRRAFDTMNLISQGDLRFGNGTLYVPGDLNLAAAQIYPATGASATVHAGWRGANSPYASDRRLVISRSTDTNPTLPYSVFGSLTLGGHTIDQGGIVRAPLGAINLGTSSGPAWNTHTVNLLPGSVTSISANGLRMPYGGTVDGITWKYDGEQVTLYSAAGSQGKEPVANRDLKVGVTLKGELVDIQNGSLIDLSGGGELLGAAFVSGRGGSTDARFNPLMQYGADGFLLPALATNPVYALVPGVQSSYAPAAGASGALDPMLGQQVTIGAGVPGLPAGTYTLLPSTYALLPGAFRVEVNGLAGQGAATAVTAMRNGSWSASGVLSIAGTGIRDSLASQLFITSADQLRRYSQYNETSYADFVRADAGRLSVPRGMLEADAKTLQLHLRNSVANDESVNFRFNGSIAGDAAQGGFGSTVAVWDRNAKIELLADNGQATAGFVSLYASDLSAMNVSRLVVGGRPVVTYGQGGNFVDFGTIDGAASTIVLRSGAKLSAGEVMLVTNQFYAAPSGIEIEQGASISTLGRGTGAYDSSDGFIYQAGDKGILAVSNGRLQWLAPAAIDTLAGPGSIRVGTCSGGNCAGDTTLYSEGSIGFLTDSTFELDDTVRYGTRHLTLGVGAFNIGSADALAAASARGALAPGLALDQTLLQRLMRGDSSVGAPALETLELAAAESLNFFGSVTLSTLNEQGESLLDNLMLSTPAIYGYGTAEDRALIQTGNLIWNGTAQRPGAVVSDGAGTGSGTLAIEAQRIEFGYGAFAQPAGVKDLARLALGFANVNLSASERITANHKGSLSVYQHQGAYVEGEGYRYSGGNLNILTPLMTGEAGSVNRLTAGGAVTVTGSGVAGDVAVNSDALGAELAISGRSLLVDTTVVLPSGKLSLEAEDDLILADGALLDVAGRSVEFFGDEAATRYSWGGDILLKSQSGNISQAAGSRIDLSAKNNQAGRLTAIALGQSAGKIDLQGQVTASASGYHNAGGTRVPYQAGGVDIRAQHLGDGSLSEGFAALNQRLNQGQVFGTRSFQLKQGDLVIGDGLKAGAINVSVDGGHLSVNGTVDASGERVGSIRLAGKHGLSIGGNAVLDAHGTVLRVDSHGQIIDSPNRATVELSSGDGQLILADGARIDLRHGTATTTGHDGKARGTLELNAPRLGGATAGDIDIDARGSLTIEGAKLIAVNGVQRYDDAEYGTAPAASGRPYQVIDQDYLNSKHSDSLAFINNALANGTLLDGKLSGLNNAAYNDAFHLRPGVEIVSATPDGDIVVSGDLDLSGFRYASLNPHTQKTSVYGSGETGSLVVRAGGDLSVYGSINDGFAPPPETPDDEGWQLTPGYIAHGGDVVVPGPGVVLAGGTEFAAGKTLNYDLPVQAANYPAGTQLPTQGVLETSLTLQAGTVLRGDVHDASGNLLYAAGTLLESAVTLPADSRLGAGSVLPAQARLRAMTWPKGAPLPAKLVLSADLGLMVGALIPSETLVKLPSDAIATPLRPLTGTRQGSNWAVAEMLPEGSQSWSMRFVAGADTQAADTRAVRVDREAGTLILADTHYSMLKRIEGGGVQYWSEGNFFGATPGTPVDDWALDPSYNVCVDEVGQCVLVSWLWSEDNFFGATPGTPVDDWALDPSYNVCVDEVGQCVNIGGDGELVGLHPATQALSVLRTGTGDLDLIAGGDLHMQSLYGAYTAGMSTASLAGSQATAFNQPRTTGGDGTYLGTSGGSETAISDAYEALVNGGANSTYAAWYPDLGGNLLVRTGGDLTGDLLADGNPSGVDRHLRPQTPSVNLNHWLWRQSSADVAGVGPIPTSWWINFGTYVAGGRNTNSFVPEGGGVQSVPELVGFTGFGTLGGGNLSVDVGGDAGMLSARGTLAGAARSQGLALAVGSTGRVTADGELLLTGGGDMQVRIRGDLNPGLQARAEGHTQNVDLGGVLTNLRGDLQMTAGALGGIEQLYSSRAFGQDLKESRAYDPFTSTTGFAAGGMVLMLGDAVANLSTRGDLVLAGSGDPGRISQLAGPAYTYNGQTYATFTGGSNSGVNSWFSLWTENTAINLLSAGGNLTPSIQLGTVSDQGTTNLGRNHSTSDGRFVYPSQLNAVAAKGSIYMGASALGLTIAGSYNTSYSLLVAPSINASLSLLAGDSIYAGGYAVNQSGASLNAMPAPLRPAFVLTNMASLARLVARTDGPDVRTNAGRRGAGIALRL